MRILSIECSREEKDFVSADLCEAGTLGVAEEELAGGRWRLEACFDSPDEDLAARFSSYTASVRQAGTVDWVALAQSRWEPFPVGQRFFLVPAWRDDPAPPGRLRLVMPPGTASGTGLHPATQLALQGLERALRPGDTVLDLGCGSGILAAGARLLGAGSVYACDVDADAVVAARLYLGMSARLFTGSARSLRRYSMDVVVANLNAQALAVVAADVARILKAAGRAVVCGFDEDRIPRITKLLAEVGLSVSASITTDGYAALIVTGTGSNG